MHGLVAHTRMVRAGKGGLALMLCLCACGGDTNTAPDDGAVVTGRDGGATNEASVAPGDDGAVGLTPGIVSAPRPIAPLSTATVTSPTPVFRWALGSDADGAQVDLCRDRACSYIVTSFHASGTSGALPTELSAGV